MSERALSVHLPREASWPGEDIRFPGFPTETSAMRAILPGYGSWRRGGTAWVFLSAIACGRGEIFNWKLG